jgi:hypothetical protein
VRKLNQRFNCKLLQAASAVCLLLLLLPLPLLLRLLLLLLLVLQRLLRRPCNILL